MATEASTTAHDSELRPPPVGLSRGSACEALPLFSYPASSLLYTQTQSQHNFHTQHFDFSLYLFIF